MKKIACCLALLVTQVVYAQNAFEKAADDTFDYARKVGIGGSIGHSSPIFGNEFNNEADGGGLWDIHARYHLNTKHGLEAAFTRYEFDDTTKAIQTWDLLWFMRFRPDSRFTPIFGAGIGLADIANYDPNSVKLSWNARGGIEYGITRALSMNLTLDYMLVSKMFFAENLDENVHNLSARFGLTYYFNGGAEGTVVAPAAAATVTKSIDADKDGVNDKVDNCLGTERGVIVNSFGCADGENVTLNVLFENNQDNLDENYDQDLRELAQFMEENPEAEIDIQGHTDSSGSTFHNDELSQQRAEAVRDYLVEELNANPEKVHATGFGEKMPVAPNSTEEGRKENRRVEAQIYNSGI